MTLSPTGDKMNVSSHTEETMKITTPQLLATAVQNARKKQNLTQAEASKLVGIKQSTFSNFENNPENTKMSTLFKILAALELEIEITPRNKGAQKDTKWDQEW